MLLLVKLLLAHFVGDFLLQPNSWVQQKKDKGFGAWTLYAHFIVHGVLVMLVLWDWSYWPVALLIMLSHAVIDVLKLAFKNSPKPLVWFFIDQLLHLAVIIALWAIWLHPQGLIPNLFNNPLIWVLALSLVLITIVASITINHIMNPWSEALGDVQRQSLKNAGQYIGMLERLLVFVFVLYGRWEGIGFLLAAKSVFRFGDLQESKNWKLTEYILIGTLLSFGIAIAVALMARGLLGI